MPLSTSSISMEGLFSGDDACALVDLLKLGVADRAGSNAKEGISTMLLGMVHLVFHKWRFDCDNVNLQL